MASTSASLSSIYEKLSSGQRINKASDDAAGLSVASSLNTDSRVYTQAIRNVNDGLSLLNIADGAVDALSNIIIRIRELTEQSANGTYTNRQRDAMDDEAQALSKEFFRISRSAKFNGQGLFDGTLSDGLRVQCGYGVDGSIQSTLGGKLGTGSFDSGQAEITELSLPNPGDCYGAYFRIHSPSQAYYVWFNGGSDADPAGTGIGIEVDLSEANSSADVAAAVKNAMQTQAPGVFLISDAGAGVLHVENVTPGFATDAIDWGSSTSITVLQQGGKQAVSTGLSTSAVSVGDLNADGILDAVMAGHSSNRGRVSVLIGRGDGTFTNMGSYATETWGGGIGNSRAVTLGDANGDGIMDIVTAGQVRIGSFDQGQVSVLIGHGDGTFGSAVSYATETSATGHARSRGVSLGDLNGDGVLDIVTAGYAHDGSNFQARASVLLGQGNGTFAEKVTFATDTSGSVSYNFGVTLGDVNNDGILDLGTAGEAASWGKACVRLGRGDGTFGSNLTLATDVAGGKARAIALVDTNGDGNLDLLTAGWGGAAAEASVRLGRGNGSFGVLSTYQTGTGWLGENHSMALGDVNGDGILDVVAAGRASLGGAPQAAVLLGQGDGTFRTGPVYATNDSSGWNYGIQLGDLNRDGILDFVTAGNARALFGLSREGVAPILPFSLRSMADARQAMGMLDSKLDSLSTQRGVIGAFQSRLQVATNNLTVSRENFQAAGGRIKDTDVAAESSSLVRTQILQQAASAVLAQANQQPALAIQLLSG